LREALKKNFGLLIAAGLLLLTEAAGKLASFSRKLQGRLAAFCSRTHQLLRSLAKLAPAAVTFSGLTLLGVTFINAYTCLLLSGHVEPCLTAVQTLCLIVMGLCSTLITIAGLALTSSR
jgi:hypothetical protein